MRTLRVVVALTVVLSACTPAVPPLRPVGTPDSALASALAFADSTLAEAVAAEVLPGAVLLVARDGVVLHEKAFGYARLYEGGTRLKSPEPMTVGHIFDLASVTKVMAITWAMMLLVDRGLVELDDPVYTYLPDFRGPDKDRITLRDLLTHRSGLHRWKPVYYHAGSPAEAYAYIRDLPLEFEVAEARRYSDLGFMVAGYIVEAVTGRPLDLFLGQELYGPLGLTRTGFLPERRGNGWPRSALPGGAWGSPSGPEAAGAGIGFAIGTGGSRPRRLTGPFAATSHGNPYERRMVEDDSFGYLCDEDPAGFAGWRTHTLQGEVNDGNAWHAHGGVAGHAGLFSHAEDLSVLLEVLLDEGRQGSRRVVGPEVVGEFLAPDTLTGNGVGWAMSRMDGGDGGDGAAEGEEGRQPGVQVFSHSGFTGTYVLGAPELGLAVVFLSNRQNVGVDADGYYPDAADVYMPVVRRILEAAAEGARVGSSTAVGG
jgi:serine-type D-Ala-D-Ala carboxypeptidase